MTTLRGFPSVFPHPSLIDNAAPQTASTLCQGDVVILGFRQTSGAVCLTLLPLVNIASGTPLNVARYARTASLVLPSQTVQLTQLTSVVEIPRGRPLVLRTVGSTVQLQTAAGAAVAETAVDQAWSNNAAVDDTVLLYTRTPTQFKPLHAVGFRGVDGSVPSYGGLCAEATVTLAPPTAGLASYAAVYIDRHYGMDASSVVTTGASELLVPSSALPTVPRTMFMGGSAGFARLAVGLEAAQVTLCPSVGAMVFTQFTTGSVTNGLTQWDLVVTEPLVAFTPISFGTSPLARFSSPLQRTNPEGFTVQCPTDVAVGDVMHVEVGVSSVGVNELVVVHRPRSGSVAVWTPNVVHNTLTPATPSSAWSSVYAQVTQPGAPQNVLYTIASAYNRGDTTPTLGAVLDSLPVSSRQPWPQVGAVLPTKRLLTTPTTKQLLKTASPEPGSMGVVFM